GPPAQVLEDAPLVPPIVELGRAAGWRPLPLTVRDARRRARTLAVPPAPVTAPAAGGPVLVDADRVSVVHGRTVAVRELDLSLSAGTITALMGRNGSGKSSLLWALQGSGARRSGRVTVE